MLWLLPALGVYWALRRCLPDDHTLAQIAAIPFCVIALASIEIGGRVFARWLLFLSAAAALAIALSPYLFPKNTQRNVFVERFKGDTLGSRTRIFIEALNSSFERNGDVRATEWRSIASAAAPQISFMSVLEQIFFSGDEKLLRLHLGRSKSIMLDGDSFPGRFLAAANLELVTWVPVVALSSQPYQATADFLTTLLAGILPTTSFERGDKSTRDQSILNADQEMLLWSATMRSDRWRSAAHRALPAWILGNRYLVEAFRGGAIDLANLKCALKSYDIAARFMRFGDNPELFAAINNNRGIAWYLMSLVTGRSEYRSHARKYLSLAVGALKQPNLFKLHYYSGHIARRNLARLGIAGAGANMGQKRKGVREKNKRHARQHRPQAAIKRSTKRNSL